MSFKKTFKNDDFSAFLSVTMSDPSSLVLRTWVQLPSDSLSHLNSSGGQTSERDQIFIPFHKCLFCRFTFVLLPFVLFPLCVFPLRHCLSEPSEPTVIIKTVNLHIQSSFFLFFFNSTVTLSSSSPRKDNTQHLFNYLFSHHPKKMTNANSGPFPSWASKCSLVLKKVNPFRFLHIDMPIMSNRGIGIRQGNSA